MLVQFFLILSIPGLDFTNINDIINSFQSIDTDVNMGYLFTYLGIYYPEFKSYLQANNLSPFIRIYSDSHASIQNRNFYNTTITKEFFSNRII